MGSLWICHYNGLRIRSDCSGRGSVCLFRQHDHALVSADLRLN